MSAQRTSPAATDPPRAEDETVLDAPCTDRSSGPLDLQLAPSIEQEPPLQPEQLSGLLIGGRYRVGAMLARGGMGWIFHGVHERLGKPVAIKVLLRPENEAARLRLQREARLMCRVRHPLVVAAEDFGETDDGQPYLVLEFQDGPTLFQVLATNRRLPPARAVSLALQLIAALEVIHRQGIIHRDLKPSNVFLVPGLPGQDVVRIGDFGLARSVDPGAGESRLTRIGTIMGTPEYMAPEQAAGEDATAASDQYALGCMLYEMIGGRVPFTGRSATIVLQQQIGKQPTPLRAHAPEVPEPLAEVVMRTLQKDPAGRFPDIAALRAALQSTLT